MDACGLRTARTGPAGDNAVYRGRGRTQEDDTVSRPCTTCVIVRQIIGTRKKFFFASSTPLEMA